MSIDIAQAAATPADPIGGNDLGVRLAALGSVHPWLEPDTATAIAQAAPDAQTAVQHADQVKALLQQTWDGFTASFDDPVLHKQDSNSLKLARVLTAAVGPIPVAQPDLTQIQTALQRNGFATDLPADGTWNAAWQGEYKKYADASYAQQAAAGHGQGLSIGHHIEAFLSSLLPSHAIPAIVGYVKSIPGDVRSLVADQAAFLTGDAHQIGSGGLGSVKGVGQTIADALVPGVGLGRQALGLNTDNQPGAEVGARIESLGRAKGEPSAEQYRQRLGFDRLVNDFGTILLATPVAGEETFAARMAKAEIMRGLDYTAATRGPGVIARRMFGGLDQDQLGNNAARHGLLSNQWQRNAPLYRHLAPIVGKLADADGHYYQLRSFLARPYAHPGVRIAGTEFNRAMIYGTGVQGVAAAAPQGNIAANIKQVNDSFTTADVNMARILHSPLREPFHDALDSFAVMLHAPSSGEQALSNRVGANVQGMVDTTSDALGKIDLGGIIQLATGLDSDGLRAAFGSDEGATRWANEKLADLAAGHYVDAKLKSEGVNPFTEEGQDRAAELADEVWSNPDVHNAAISDLLADPYETAVRWQEDWARNDTKPAAALADAGAYSRAGSLLTDLIGDGLGRHLFGPDGIKLVADARDVFDHTDGLPRPNGLTRAEYVQQVGTLLGRLQRTVGASRAAMQADVERAQQALQEAAAGEKRSPSQTLRQAKARLAAFEDMVNGRTDTTRLARLMDKGGNSFSYLKRQYKPLHADYSRLRQLVTAVPETEFHLGQALSDGIDADALYTKAAGVARPIPDDIGTGDWLADRLPHKPGTLGLFSNHGLSAQQAANHLNAAETAINSAGKDPEKLAAIEGQLKDWAHAHFNWDTRALGMFDGNPAGLLRALRQRSGRLASEVFVTPDAPPAVTNAIAQMKALGYRPALGSHIGHLWDGSLPSWRDIDGTLTRRRRIANALGVNPDQISSMTAGHKARVEMIGELNKALHDQRGQVPAYATPATIMSVLREVLEPTVPTSIKVGVALSRGITGGRAHSQEIERLMKRAADAGQPISKREAIAQHEAAIARGLQLRDISRKDVLEALTTPSEFANGAQWPGMDKTAANLVYRALLRGYQRRGATFMGWQAIEDWGRAGLGFGDKLAVAHPNSDWLQSAANLPNQLVVLRNRLRFTLSPLFDARRLTKTNYKMALEGVDPQFNPGHRMMTDGTFDAAHALLDRLQGHPDTAGIDEAERYLHSQSVFALFNERNYEAYFAHTLAQRGASDDEIRAGLRKVFNYGSARKDGRSPLERSMNTVFFPFSFEKTLLRNTGGYLLDHVGQRTMLTAAIAAYEQANSNGQITAWAQDHLPILRDIQKLNAFAHGVDLGELGGINAPLLNLFLPQSWGGGLSKQALGRYLPVWHDFGQVWSNATQQAMIGKNAALNAVDWATNLGKQRSFLHPYRPTETTFAQRRDAGETKGRLVIQLQPVLAWNREHPTAEIFWPDSPDLPPNVRSQPVNRTSIGYLVQRWYPAYDPAVVPAFAVSEQQKVKQFIAQAPPDVAPALEAFRKVADKASARIDDGTYDTPTAQRIFADFRAVAAQASEQDPNFYKFYKQFYAYAFGPLEEVTDLGRHA